MTSSASPTGNGYNCATCGMFIPNGTYHNCLTGWHQGQRVTNWNNPYELTLQRIATALERIADELGQRNADALGGQK